MELVLTPSLQFHPLKTVCLWKIDFHIVVTVSASVDVVRRSLLSYCWCWHWVCGVVSWLYSEKSVDVNMFSTSSWHQVIRVWLLFQGTGEHAFGCCHFCFSCCYHYIFVVFAVVLPIRWCSIVIQPCYHGKYAESATCVKGGGLGKTTPIAIVILVWCYW